MLGQVLAAGPLGQYRDHELAGDIELVEAREEDLLDPLLAVALGHQIAPQDLQPTLPLPDGLPEIGGPVPVRVRRVARPARVAPVEGQESGP
jgi:hypothetical protein